MHNLSKVPRLTYAADLPPTDHPMPVAVQCPKCQLSYNLPDQMAGKQAKCKCGEQLTIPAAMASVRVPSPTATAQTSRPIPPTYQPVPAQVNVPQPAFSQPTNAPAGLWQAGNLLVMSVKAHLPLNVCIKTGGPAALQRTEKLTWVPAWVAVTALKGRITHHAASQSHGRELTVRFGVSRGAHVMRLLPLIAGYTLVGLGLFCFFGNIAWMFTFHQESDPIPLVGFLVGGLIGVVGAILAQFVSSFLKATAMDENFAVLRGVSPTLLVTLPPWPGPVPEGTSK